MSKRLYNKFLSNNIWVTIGHIFIYAKGIILLPILIKNIGVNLYGGYSILITFISVTFGISSFGVGFKFQRYLPAAEEKETKRNLFYNQFIFQSLILLLFSILLLITAGHIKKVLFKNEADFSILLVCGALFATFYFTQVSNYFRYSNKMRDFSIITVFNPYLNILIIIIGINYFKLLNLDFLLAASVVSMVVVSLPHSFRLISEIGIKLPRLKLLEIWEDLKLGFPIMLSYVLDFILAGSDRFIIAVYMNLTQVGYYNPAYTLGSLIVMFPKVMGVALPPILSKAVDEGNENIAIVMLNKSIKFYLTLVIPFIVGSLLLSYDILQLLANKQVAQNSYFITPIVSLGILFYGLTIIVSEGIAFVKLQTKLIFYSNVVAAGLSLLLNFMLLYFFKNILIPAIVTFVSYLVSFLYIYYNTRKIMPVSFDTKFILKIFSGSIIMGIFIYLVKGYIYSKIEFLLVILPAAVCIYFISLLFLKTFEKEEVNFIRNYMLSVIKK